MLDLEEKLLADADGSVRRKLIAELREMQQRLHRELRQMNSQSRYLELQGAMQAVTAAVQVLQTLSVPVVSGQSVKSRNNK
jgi:type III secretion system YseE family protein